MELMFEVLADVREAAWEITHERKARRAKVKYHGEHRAAELGMPARWQVALWLAALVLLFALMFGAGLG